MLNLLKRWVVNLAGKISQWADPYDEFTRPVLPPRNNQPLAEKAQAFLTELHKDFSTPQGLFLYRRSRVGEEADYGDQALHHGLATTALAFGRACGEVSSDELYAAVRALKFLFKNRWLVRGIDPRDPTKFKDDCSNDSATGVIAGAYFGAKLGKSDSGCEAIDIVAMLADELIDHDYSLVRQDGSPTTYGKLIDGFKTVPQLAALALAIFRVAHVLTGQAKYGEHFAKLYAKYGALLATTEFKFLDYTKTHETHRCAIALHILADLGMADRQLIGRCTEGLRRIWELHRKERNPWLAALVNKFWKIPEPDLIDVARRMCEFDPVTNGVCLERANSREAAYWGARGVKFILVQNNIRSSQPLPYHVWPQQDFPHQRHPYTSDGWQGSTDDFKRYNGVGFLAPYYMLRHQAILPADM